MNEELNYCRVCNSSKLELYETLDSQPLYMWPLGKDESSELQDVLVFLCKHCGHIQLKDTDESTLAKIYRDIGYNLESEEVNKKRFELIVGNSNDLTKKRILEIGGGRNSFVKYADNTIASVCDFSVNEEIKEIVSDYYEGDFLKADYPSKTYDYIMLFHVLEHFNNPLDALIEIKRILKDNGKIFIEVPNAKYYADFIPCYCYFHMHISLFYLDSLKNILVKSGLHVSHTYVEDEVLLVECEILKNSNKINNNYIKSLELVEKINKNNKHIGDQLSKLSLGSSVSAIFGAGGTATTFLYLYPDLINQVTYALDNDSKKYNKFLCNGSIKIIKPSEAENYKLTDIIYLDKEHEAYLKESLPNDCKLHYIGL